MNQNDSMKITRYTPDSQARTPWKMARAMWVDIRSSRELAWRLFVRDLSAQYRQSLFGFLWAFAPPIFTSLIFIVLNSRNILNIGETDIPYPVFVLVGTLLWQIFTESLNAPLKSAIASKPLLVKVNFTHEALILSALYLVVFNTLIKLVILFGVILIFQIPLSWGMLWALLPIFGLIFLGIGFGLVITPVGMLYTDVSTSLPILTQLLFFLTPVVYPVPQTLPFSLIAIVNPVTPYLEAARDLITTGTLNNISQLIIVSGFTIILTFVAWMIFRLALPIIIERISA